MNMKSLPGPDGLTSCLYYIVTNDWCYFSSKNFNNFVESRILSNILYLAIINLLPKSETSLQLFV